MARKKTLKMVVGSRAITAGETPVLGTLRLINEAPIVPTNPLLGRHRTQA